MLLLNQVDLTLRNQDGQLAKDLTQNPKILRLIADCENLKPDEKLEVADVILEAEEDEDENYLGTNFSNSPTEADKRKQLPFAHLAGSSMTMKEPANASYAFQENTAAASSMLAFAADYDPASFAGPKRDKPQSKYQRRRTRLDSRDSAENDGPKASTKKVAQSMLEANKAVDFGGADVQDLNATAIAEEEK